MTHALKGIQWITAAEKGEVNTIRTLANEGFDINFTDQFLNTAAHWAAFYNQCEVIRLLILLGCDLNRQADGGDTPLHLAAFRNNFEVVKCLIQAGADPFVEQKRNTTAKQYAIDEGHTQIADYLASVVFSRSLRYFCSNWIAAKCDELLLVRPFSDDIKHRKTCMICCVM
jgi:ankyrin repeat protein